MAVVCALLLAGAPVSLLAAALAYSHTAGSLLPEDADFSAVASQLQREVQGVQNNPMAAAAWLKRSQDAMLRSAQPQPHAQQQQQRHSSSGGGSSDLVAPVMTAAQAYALADSAEPPVTDENPKRPDLNITAELDADREAAQRGLEHTTLDGKELDLPPLTAAEVHDFDTQLATEAKRIEEAGRDAATPLEETVQQQLTDLLGATHVM